MQGGWRGDLVKGITDDRTFVLVPVRRLRVYRLGTKRPGISTL